MPERWEMSYRPLSLRFHVAPTPFRHTGFFPEQAAHWTWLVERSRGARVLVLFGYTGLATLAVARGGGQATHVDASRPAIGWARDNAALSGLEARWLLDDALKFVQREARRGARYDGVVMDPPAFGRGPKGEVWRFAESMPTLLDAIASVLARSPRFVLLNAYAVPVPPTVLANMLADVVGREAEAGELAVEGGGRTLPTGIYARWAAS